MKMSVVRVHPQGLLGLPDHEDEGTVILQNTGKYTKCILWRQLALPEKSTRSNNRILGRSLQ